MTEYLISVIGAALLAGVIGAAVPTGNGEGLKKYVGYIGALCVLCVMIAPAGRVLDYISEFARDGISDYIEESEQGYNEKYSEYLLSLGRDNIEEGIKSLLCDEFGIPADECGVSARVSELDGELHIDSVTVLLSGASIFKDPYKIEDYLSSLLGCECSVSG